MTANCSFPALVAGIALWQIVLYLSKMGGVGGGGGTVQYIYVCVHVCVLPSVFHPMCLSVFRATLLTCSRVSALRTITHGIRSINNY